MTATSVLVIAPAPDQRESTQNLRSLVDELARQPGTRVAVWFLYDGPSRDLWPDARVVDSLRTARSVQVLRTVGLNRVADHVAGLLLRRWRSSVAPDLVVLDDGLGGRVLGGSTAPVVVRTNETPAAPYILADEAGWDGPAVAELVALGSAARTDLPAIVEPPPALGSGGLTGGDRLPLDGLRQVWRLPTDRRIVGWWADGGAPELRRAIGELAVGGLVVGEGCDLLWLVDRLDRDVAASIGALATELGIEGRLHVRPAAGGAALGACDLVVRPAMVDDPMRALDWALSGAVVVGPARGPGTTWMVPASEASVVPDAEQVARAMSGGGEERAMAAHADLDLRQVARVVVASAGSGGDSLRTMPAARGRR